MAVWGSLTALLLCLSAPALFLPNLAAGDNLKCDVFDQQSQCRCIVQQHNKGLDLTGITDQFKAIAGEDQGRTYGWGPCAGTLNLGGSCTPNDDAAICQNDGGTFYLIGKHAQQDWETDVDQQTTVIKYFGGDESRLGQVTVTCDKTKDPGEASFVNENPTLTYNLKYTGKYGCLIDMSTGSPPTNKNSKISVGTILIIVFIAVVIVYFIVGLLVMRFHRGAQGAEIIPNKDFWLGIPLLIKDGALFIVSPCRGGPKGGDYEKL